MRFLQSLPALLCVALSVRAASEGNQTSASADPKSSARQVRLNFCLSGWNSFRGNCYHLVNHPDTWSNAEKYCQSFEGNLASAHGLLEYRFLQRLASTGGHSFAWMGGFFFQDEWRWEDGTPFDYAYWESVASTSSYQCLQLDSDESRGWSNHGCTMIFPFICQLSSNC